ncbi:uncharacterized protein LOC127723867 [Mytilus californianus]|uniref:uncharacterized protein LOC127723867 n=1 Tax=Mytilus californianus TaxID=6549 RepID=UPI00224532CC|nr:uncharacterized protein LOC127723867 [Mytilus californianus]
MGQNCLHRYGSSWLLLFFILCPPVHSGTKKDLNLVKSGLETGKGIAALIEVANFEQTLAQIGKSIGPYLGAIGPFIGLISVIIPSESKELSYMKEMMKYIDNRFDQMDKRFDSIEQMIKWNVVQVNFGQIEQRIKAMAREYRYLCIVPPVAVENRKKIYISNYESDYQNSGTKLYQSIVKEQGTLQEDLGTSVLRYTDSDRTKTQLFLLGVMQLLLQSIKIELAYLFSYKYDHNANFMKSQWINRTEEVQTKFKLIDDQCINAYFAKSLKDIDEFSAKNYGKPNNKFATELFDLLSGKYFWRDWIVVAYNPISGDDKYFMSVKGGHILLLKHGRNLLVTSVDKNHPVMNLSGAKEKLNKISVRHSVSWLGVSQYVNRSAKDIFNKIDKTGASLVIVIECAWNAAALKCDTNRLLSDKRCPYHWIIMWG